MDKIDKLIDNLVSSPFFCNLCAKNTFGSSNGPLCNCIEITCALCGERFRTTSILLKGKPFHDCPMLREENFQETIPELGKEERFEGPIPEDIRKIYKEYGLLTGDYDFDAMLDSVLMTLQTKGEEYTGGSPDRLDNFRQCGRDVGIPMEKVWYVFFNKHVRAVASYIKNGCVVKSNESIHGRIMDLIVYLLLFEKMVIEITGKRRDEENGLVTQAFQVDDCPSGAV
jgi:hypothetical protein